jgi:hypothetical protein
VKVSVEIAGAPRESSLPGSQEWINVDGACPSCRGGEFRVIGDVRRQNVGHDTVTAPALSLCCGQEVGVVRVEFATIFGLEEDRAVLHGRPRVY